MTTCAATSRRNSFVLSASACLVLAISSPAFADADPANLSWAAMRSTTAASATPTAERAGPGAATEMARSDVARQVAAVAARHGVPVRFALAVARLESNMRCQARGRHGELGPLQIKPATARGLGYTGPAAALNSCGAGLEWGMRHLAVAYRQCGSAAAAASLHNRGLASACTTRTAYSGRVSRLMASL